MSPHSYANKILDSLRIRDPEDLKDLEAIAWQQGAVIRRAQLTGTAARLSFGETRSIITVDRAQNRQRTRFSIAHELGHLAMHREKSSLSLCTSEDIQEVTSGSGKDVESEANRFAASLLMPEALVRPHIREEPPSFDVIKALARNLRTSLTATAIRYVKFASEPCAVVYSRDGKIRWFRGSDDFHRQKFFIHPKTPVDQFSLAGEFFEDGKEYTSREDVEAGSWLAEGRHSEDAMISEETVVMPNYNAALSLIWINEDILDGNYY